MAETLLSLGLDVGTTSTQMVVSKLQIQNRASGFSVPELTITDRQVIYRSPVHFTPLKTESLIDGQALAQLLDREYEQAGVTRRDIQTGAVIITGETSRKENADSVLQHLSHLAGDFVVATAGPDLESRLAALGSGAVEFSRKTGKTVLHMDIGGGTSNLALICKGEIMDTGCLNVGGRLIRFDPAGFIQYVSPVLAGLTDRKPGDRLSQEEAWVLAQKLAQILEMGAGLREPDGWLTKMVTREGRLLDPSGLEGKPVISVSGGVADCIEEEKDWMQFGDLGPLLGQAIRESRLSQGEFRLGEETIRATVIGAGCHSTQLSGSTVFYRNVKFPLRDLPAVPVSGQVQEIRKAVSRQDGPCVLALKDPVTDYRSVQALADRLAEALETDPCYLCLGQDAAKALGQALALRMPEDTEILCLDRVSLGENSYLDVGEPLGPAIPVVVKTLVLGNGG